MIKQVFQGALGQYPLDDRMTEYDSVIANSFGTSTDYGSINATIMAYAKLMAKKGDRTRPIIMDEALTRCEAYGGYQPALIVRGKVSNGIGQGVGTWGVLLEAKPYLDEHGLKRPLLVGHGNHIGRTLLQARKLGMDPVTLRMPVHFDYRSRQIWTRNLPLWFARELVGAPLLKIQGKL